MFTLSESNKERELITNTNPKSPTAEAFRTLRTNLHFSGLDNPYKTIMFTSAGPEDGKSTLLSNTAVAMAQAENKVLIVDCDLRKPVQHKIFDVPNIQGIINILVDEKNPMDIIQETDIKNIFLLPSGPIPPNPSELLASKRMTKFIDFIKDKFDTILFDSPPVIAVTDSVILSAKVDGVVLVLRAAKTKIDIAKEAKEQLEKANAKIIGTVLNYVKYKGKDYEYYYYYGKEKEKPVSKKSLLSFNFKWRTSRHD